MCYFSKARGRRLRAERARSHNTPIRLKGWYNPWLNRLCRSPSVVNRQRMNTRGRWAAKRLHILGSLSGPAAQPTRSDLRRGQFADWN